MKRERALQVVLVLVGLFYSFWGYLLFDDLWHSRWLSGHSDVMPMFLSLNTALGVCLLLAVRQPAKHRLMIAYGAWSSLAHAFTMTIMSAQAVAHGTHRQDSPQDIVMFVVIGGTLLALLPAKQASPAGAPISEPRFAERWASRISTVDSRPYHVSRTRWSGNTVWRFGINPERTSKD